jgi:hypothetical protein
MNDVVLTCSVKYLAFEETMRRVPTSKPSGLFGTAIRCLSYRKLQISIYKYLKLYRYFGGESFLNHFEPIL